jgi:hypothetical protein
VVSSKRWDRIPTLLRTALKIGSKKLVQIYRFGTKPGWLLV